VTSFADVAAEIAHGIAADAIWYEDRCNWIGSGGGGGSRAPVLRSLGPDLYGGTAGIGVVLAEIASAADDAALRRAGAGALRHAIVHLQDIPPPLSDGLFTGRLGVGLAVVRGGRLLDEPDLVEGGAALLGDVAKGPGGGDRNDLIGGRSGAVLGALMSRSLLGTEAALDRAWRGGEELLGAAEDEARGGRSWPDPSVTSGGNLTGLSHGAAGVAHALTELAVATGDPRFRAGASAGIAYERELFDPVSGNWADLRTGAEEEAGRARARSLVFWCHGAPGIALARRRAWELTREPGLREEMASGLDLTARWVRAALRAPGRSYCLCHGIAGNAEVLLDSASMAGERAGEYRRIALEAAEAGVEEYAARGAVWPCGPPGHGSPSLMTGLAGIARFYLRLADSSLPSLLLPSPGDPWLP
jgi:lantibiotic biosynthesis protein